MTDPDRKPVSPDFERAFRQHVREMRELPYSDEFPEVVYQDHLPLAHALALPGTVSSAERQQIMEEFRRTMRLMETALEMRLFEPSSAQLREPEVLAGAVSGRLSYYYHSFRVAEIYGKDSADELERSASGHRADERTEATMRLLNLFTTKPRG